MLPEAVLFSVSRISEYKASNVEDRDFVSVVQLSPLVTANVGVVDVCAVPGKIFEDTDGFALLVFVEQQAVPIADGGQVDPAIYNVSSVRPYILEATSRRTALRMSAYEVPAGRGTALTFGLLVLLLLLHIFHLAHLLFAVGVHCIGSR